MKVFGVGLIKTGTTSFGEAMKRIGFNHRGGGFGAANQLVFAYMKGDNEAFKDFIDPYDSFEDFPFCAPKMTPMLDKLYPDSKFVLTTREPESWFRSLCNYFNPPGKEPASLLAVSQRDDHRPLGRFYGLINYMLATFGTLEMEANKEHYISTFEAYNQGIVDFFKDRPQQLLVVNWADGDGYPELCGFLNKKIPKGGFPCYNKNRGNK